MAGARRDESGADRAATDRIAEHGEGPCQIGPDDVDLFDDVWSTTPAAPEPLADVPAAVDPDDTVVGLRKAHQDHLPEVTLAALRWARSNGPDFPAHVDKREVELFYRIDDLKKWARNRPRATGTADLRVWNAESPGTSYDIPGVPLLSSHYASTVAKRDAIVGLVTDTGGSSHNERKLVGQARR